MSAQQQQAERQSVDWVTLAAGALAAMVSAVLLSTLGAAGTVIGAALGSVVVSVGNSLFSRGISVGKHTVNAAQSAALRRVSKARSQVGEASDHLDDSTRAQHRLAAANEELDAAESELRDAQESEDSDGDASTIEPEATEERGWRDRLRSLPWKHVLLLSGVVFVVTMVAITVFELTSGRAVSSYTGGSDDTTRTSFTGLTDTGSDSETETPEPTTGPSEGASEDASESDVTDPGEGPVTEDPTPTASPSDEPSPSSEPTANSTDDTSPSTPTESP